MWWGTAIYAPLRLNSCWHFAIFILSCLSSFKKWNHLKVACRYHDILPINTSPFSLYTTMKVLSGFKASSAISATAPDCGHVQTFMTRSPLPSLVAPNCSLCTSSQSGLCFDLGCLYFILLMENSYSTILWWHLPLFKKKWSWVKDWGDVWNEAVRWKNLFQRHLRK